MKRVFNKATAHTVLAAVGFFILVSAFRLDSLIVLLNGAFGGAMAGLLVTFAPLLYYTARGKEPYSRARQMTLGWFWLWVAYILTSYVSVWTRSIGVVPTAPSYGTVLSRYVAIYAATLQVLAPDFGLGMFYGRDRKLLWVSLAVGVVVAVCLWYAQDQAVLSDLVQDTLGTTNFGITRTGRGGVVWATS